MPLQWIEKILNKIQKVCFSHKNTNNKMKGLILYHDKAMPYFKWFWYKMETNTKLGDFM